MPQNFMDKLQTGLLGAPSSYGGLLSAEDQKEAQRQSMINLGLSLMAAGGPSSQPIGIGQALSGAVGAGQQTKAAMIDQSLNAALLKAQIEKASRPTAVKPPNSIAEYEYAKQNGFTGSFDEWKRVASAQTSSPSAVQEYEYYKSLPSEEARNEYLTVKRSMQPYQLGEMGGGKVAFNKATGQWEQISTADQEAAGAAQIAGAQKGAQVTAETTAQAQIDLPLVVDKGTEALGLIDKLRTHPGRQIATGGTRILQTQRVPGTPAYDFDVLRKQVGGQQFLQAFETLKGGGQITEKEGDEAKAAIARMDAAQSEEAYLEALDDYEKIIKKGVDRAKKKAGIGSGASGNWGDAAPEAPSGGNVVNWDDL